MSGRVFTYPISNKVTVEVIDELEHYSALRRLYKLKGENVDVYVVTYGLDDEDLSKIRGIDENFNVLKVEDYLENLNDFIERLYNDGNIQVKERRSFYCSRCDAYYTQNEIKVEEREQVYNVIRTRIGRRLYFIDRLPDGIEPVGVAINESEKLIYVRMDRETWLAPESMREVLVKNIEVPESNIKTGTIREIAKAIRLVGYVAVGDFDTGYIKKSEEDMYNISKVISSYTVIYSLTEKSEVKVCPQCGEPVKEVVNPKLITKIEEKEVVLSEEIGAFRLPMLYCESCGHFEFGVKIRECPMCGNVMERKFFYNPRLIPIGLYFEEIEEPQKVAFIHEKRQKHIKLEQIIEVEGKKIADKTVILRHRYSDEPIPKSAYLLKKKGIIVDDKKLEKVKSVIENLFKYVSIYGTTEPKEPIDNWIVWEGEKVKREFTERIENGNFAHAFQLLRNFVIDDISHMYVGMKRKEPVVMRVLIDSVRMFYVFDPDFSRAILKKQGYDLQLTYDEVPEVKGMYIVKDVIKKIMQFRSEKDIPRREPIKKIVFVTKHEEEVKEFTSSIIKFTNTLAFTSTEKWEEMDMTIEPNVEAISRMYRAWAPKIAFLLKRKNVKDVMAALNTGGYTMGIEGFIVKITPDMVKYVEKMPKGYIKIEAKYGDLYVNSERDITTMRIRMINEVIRRINYMRKDLDIEYDDLIDVSISTDDYVLKMLKGYVDEIRERTRARNVDFRYIEYAYVVEWPIMDFDVIIGINPLFKKWVIKAFQSIPGIAENKAEMLFHMGYGSIYELMQASPSELAEIPGFSLNFANKVKDYIFNNAFRSVKEGDKEYCPFCRTEIGEDDEFCPRCGAPIRVVMERKGIEEGNLYLAWGDFSKIGTLLSTQYADDKKLLITKEDPDDIKKEYHLKNVSITWVSYVPMGKSIKPKDIDKMKEIIKKNLDKGAKIIAWDSFDFMNAINGFDAMYELLKEVREYIKESNAIFLFNVEELEDEEQVRKLVELVDGKI